MAVIVQLLNGTNQCRDAGFQAEKSALLNEGVRKNYTNELAVTTNQVATGMCFVEVTRDVVTPNETFLIPIWVTAPVTVSTSGDGWIIVRIDQDSVNDGSGNAADGSGIATVEKVASLPATDSYLILATLASGAITDARVWAQISESVVDEPIYYDEDAVGTDSYAISISGVKKYIDGKDYVFKALTTNVGAATLNINALGAKSIRKNFNIALDDGDIAAGQIIVCRYDADNDIMQMSSMLGNAGLTPTLKATQAEAEAGTEDTHFMTPAKVADAFGTIGANNTILIADSTAAAKKKWAAVNTVYGLGSTTTRSQGTNYQAATDIIVFGTCNWSYGGGYAVAECYSDSSSTPTTLVQKASAQNSSLPGAFNFPVKRGDYYRIDCPGGYGSAAIREMSLS